MKLPDEAPSRFVGSLLNDQVARSGSIRKLSKIAGAALLRRSVRLIPVLGARMRQETTTGVGLVPTAV
jgi:hypothetical protein